jgi:hypothetical protein
MTAPHRGRRGRTRTDSPPSQPQLLPVPTQGLDTDERYTPSWVFDALGATFDLDVAAPPGGVPWVPCRRFLTAEDDALGVPWHGLVWCNPPFSLAQEFSRKFLDHANGLGIFPLSQAKWVGPLLRSVDTLNIPVNIKFESPSHSGRHISFAVVFVGIGPSSGALDNLPDPTWRR